MPIEIKELHIRVNVNTSSGKSPAAPQAQTGSNHTGDKEAILAECVEQVMEIVQNKKER